ncbi:MAG: low affinity iron permease family protein [Chloroflexota bacterium]
MQELFRKFSNKVSDIAGSVYAFGLAMIVILCWAVTGPIFKFSDTWQLIINTGTTIVTFLMVFLIQNTQNRDNTALHAKLDELIVHTVGARNKLAMAEDFTEQQLKDAREHFKSVAKAGGAHMADVEGEVAETRNGRNSSSRSSNNQGKKTADSKK